MKPEEFAHRDLFDVLAMPAPRKRWRCLPVPGFMPAAKVPLPVVPPSKTGQRRIVAVDSFAGAGGASGGIKEAFRRLAEAGLLPLGHPAYPTFAINHDEPALVMHAVNYPETIHLRHNVWQVRMQEVLGDALFGFLWLSPDCRDHSSAKGGPITSRAVRDLAWVLIKWLKELPDWQRPWTICLENVGAFAKWSPLIERPDGTGFMRDPDRIGHTFHQFVHALSRFGYSVGWGEMIACEYGDPTIRKRLKLCARRDGQRIIFPKPTHGDPKSEAVKAGRLKPWPVAADILDFSLPCPSVLMTKEEARAYTKATGQKIIRPLAFKTDARLAKGVKRHAIDAAKKGEAFVVTINHAGDGFRGQGLREPLKTVAAARDAHGLVVPHMMTMRNSGKPTSAADEPTHTATAGGAHQFDVEAVLAPCIFGVGGRMGQSPPRPVSKPWQTVTAKPDAAIGVATLKPWPASVPEGEPQEVDGDFWDRLPPAWRAAAMKDVDMKTIAPIISVFRGDQIGRPATAAMPTVTANSFIKRPGGASPLGVTEARLAPFLSRGQHGGGNRSAGDPHSTIAASDGDQNQVVVPYLVPRYGERAGQEPRSIAIDRPAPTPVPDGNGGSLAAVYLAQHNTGEEGHDARRPVSTIMQKGCTQGVVAASLVEMYGRSAARPVAVPLSAVTPKSPQMFAAAHMMSLKGSDRRDGSCRDPHVAICAGGQHSAVVTLPLMTAYYSTGGQHAAIDDPMLAVPTKARFGLTQADAAPEPLTEAQLASARRVAEFLRRHGCWDGGDIVTIEIGGDTYVIVDIGMRMLTPRELARANGFPDSFILDPIWKGKPLTETEQRHKIGNAVCRLPAAAFIEANYRPPLEWGEQALREAA